MSDNNNALAMFTPSQMPAHVAGFFSEAGSNIAEKQTVPSLSYEGKTWTVSLDGNKTKLMRRNEDGDEEPLSIMRVVILDYGKKRGRAYYEGSYDPNKVSAPACWSVDGVHPDKSVQKPCASACELCPNSVKGSRVTDSGAATTACSQHRMLAVIPAVKTDFTPLRLKIAITSDWDGQSPDMEAQGWFSFSKYTDFLKSRGVQHTAAVVTKMRFDPNAAYPKLFFSADRWLDGNELVAVKPLLDKPEVQKLLGGDWTPAGVDGVATSSTPAAASEPATQAPEIKPASQAVIDQDEEIVIDLGASKPAAEEPKPAVVEKVEKAEAPAAKTAAVPDDVAALLDSWG